LKNAGINTVVELEERFGKPPDYYRLVELDGIGRTSAYEIIALYNNNGRMSDAPECWRHWNLPRKPRLLVKRPSKSAKTERNARLYAQWCAGARQTDLAQQEKLSRDRIRQILLREHRRLHGFLAPFVRDLTGAQP
jgi:hypothetical protein